MKNRFVVVAGMVLVLLGTISSRVWADPSNKNTLSVTLDCGSYGSVDVVYEYSGTDSFHVVSTTSNYLWKSLSFEDPNGETITIERGVQGKGHELVTCTYTGPISGNDYTAQGFFTP
jgi:hypothetical protein